MLKVGQKVELSSNGIPGLGGLNRVMLIEEKYHGGEIEVVEVKGGAGKVILPSGYELWITEKDTL